MKSTKTLSNIFAYVIVFLSILLVSTFSVRAALTATPVNLGVLENYTVFSNVGISSTGATLITGNIGVGDGVTSTAITGNFALAVDATNDFATSVLVTERVYAYDYTGGFPDSDGLTPAKITAATGALTTAYNAALAQTAATGPDLNIGAGTVTAQTLTPGVYTWDSGATVSITGDLTLDCGGDASKVFLFQFTGGTNLQLDASTDIILAGSCQPENVFWAVSGLTNILAGAHMEGTIIGGPATTQMTFITGSTIDGRILGQKQIALDANIITIPSPSGDTTAPVITLLGSDPVNVTINTTYTDAGATALDDVDGDITASIVVNNSVNTSTIGIYSVTYDVSDAAGNPAIQVTRTVNVLAAPVLTTIILLPTTTSIGINATLQLNATGFDQYNNIMVANISYVSANLSVVTVNSEGLVTGVDLGTATITALDGSINDTSIISVEIPVLTTIALTPSIESIAVNTTLQLVATPLDQFGNSISANISYVSNNLLVAIVNDTTGLVNAIGVGTATITVSDGAISNTSVISVEVDITAPTIISFTLSDYDVYVGDSITGTCTATDDLDLDVTTAITGIDTDSIGTKTATCTATDDSGNIATASLSYDVIRRTSSGDSGTAIINWNCTEWSECNSNETQTQTCTYLNSGTSTNSNVTRTQTCTYTPIIVPNEDTTIPTDLEDTTDATYNEDNAVTPTDTNLITGNITKENENNSWWVAALIVVAVVGLIIGGILLFQKPKVPSPKGH